MSLDTRTSTGGSSKLRTRARHRRGRRRGAAAVRRGAAPAHAAHTAGCRSRESRRRATDDGRQPRCRTRAPEAMRQFYSAIEREVRTVPGVRDVAWGSALPFDGQFFGQAFQIDGDPPRPPADRDGAGLSDRRPVVLPPARRPRARGTHVHRCRCHQRSASGHRGRSVRAPLSEGPHAGRHAPAGERDGAAAAGRAPRDRRCGEAHQTAARRARGGAADLCADRAEHLVASASLDGPAREWVG